MSTTLVVNSLVRYDNQLCEQPEPNPFEFTIPSTETGKWRMKKLPHSHFAISGRSTRDKGGYEVSMDYLSIPVSLMPDPEPIVYVQFDGTRSTIDKGYATPVQCNNALCQQIIDQTRCNCEKTFQFVSCYQPGVGGVTCLALIENCGGGLGCTGVTTAPPPKPPCENTNFSKWENVWVAYYDYTAKRANGDDFFHYYKSKTLVSVVYDAWVGSPIKVNLRDSCGNILVPEDFDPCDVCSYARLFCKENQVIAVFNHRYVAPPEQIKSTLSPDCFISEH